MDYIYTSQERVYETSLFCEEATCVPHEVIHKERRIVRSGVIKLYHSKLNNYRIDLRDFGFCSFAISTQTPRLREKLWVIV